MNLLGSLGNAQQLLLQLVKDQSADLINKRLHPSIPNLGWLLGRSVFQELYWLRQKLQHDDELSSRVQHLFGHNTTDIAHAETLLPDQEHLLNWAMEVHDQHLMWLANPGLLPDVSATQIDWTASYLTQLHAQTYEQMIAAVALQQYRGDFDNYLTQTRLTGTLDTPEMVTISQGHYRIGAKDGVVFDNEQPPQMVELHNFRIQKNPVSNAEYLSFLTSGGYKVNEFWSDAGIRWRDQTDTHAPLHWRLDKRGNWFGIGINDAADLPSNEPVRGISHYEALAYAAWAASTVKGCEGAALAHEYQWEAAIRTQAISLRVQTLEWCANNFEAYDSYQRPDDPELATNNFNNDILSVRGTGLHTLPALHRPSYRHRAPAESNYLGIGFRLIFPPEAA